MTRLAYAAVLRSALQCVVFISSAALALYELWCYRSPQLLIVHAAPRAVSNGTHRGQDRIPMIKHETQTQNMNFLKKKTKKKTQALHPDHRHQQHNNGITRRHAIYVDQYLQYLKPHDETQKKGDFMY